MNHWLRRARRFGICAFFSVIWSFSFFIQAEQIPEVVKVQEKQSFSSIVLKYFPNPEYKIYGSDGMLKKVLGLNPQIKDPSKIEVGEPIRLRKTTFAQKSQKTKVSKQKKATSATEKSKTWPSKLSKHILPEGHLLSNLILRHFPNPIYRLYGSKGMLKKVLELNPQIKNPNDIAPGTIVYLPTVDTGQVLSKLKMALPKKQPEIVSSLKYRADKKLDLVARSGNVHKVEIKEKKEQKTKVHYKKMSFVLPKDHLLSNLILKHFPNPKYRLYGSKGMLKKVLKLNPHIKNPNDIAPGTTVYMKVPVGKADGLDAARSSASQEKANEGPTKPAREISKDLIVPFDPFLPSSI